MGRGGGTIHVNGPVTGADDIHIWSINWTLTGAALILESFLIVRGFSHFMRIIMIAIDYCVIPVYWRATLMSHHNTNILDEQTDNCLCVIIALSVPPISPMIAQIVN